ncbi:hypothetical protein EIP86_004600 [Pleurotus ostreatoroseus]|nr:hypothetical protein EIP86_004600 [Pleurotus ostreatoroseus]
MNSDSTSPTTAIDMQSEQKTAAVTEEQALTNVEHERDIPASASSVPKPTNAEPPDKTVQSSKTTRKSTFVRKRPAKTKNTTRRKTLGISKTSRKSTHRSSAAYDDEYYDDEPGLFDGMDPEEAYVMFQGTLNRLTRGNPKSRKTADHGGSSSKTKLDSM